jgi:hypothetical protein
LFFDVIFGLVGQNEPVGGCSDHAFRAVVAVLRRHIVFQWIMASQTHFHPVKVEPAETCDATVRSVAAKIPNDGLSR